MDPGAPPPPPAPRGSLWRRISRLPLSMMLASVLSALGIVQLSFQLGNTAYRSLTWSAQTRETKARIQALERDVKILKDAERNASNPDYLREQARCQGFVGADEQVVVATNAPEIPGENCRVVRLP
ncbi:cell division protein FtsB [Deinococcus hohokamensis]|uniref:Cell division protein FtsB n=1 Tax=Deinococcus hohokamensis TaxID=309883 RepID=A0ABV9IF58_9DEIO